MRMAANLTQVKLAERVGVSQVMIAQIERGSKIPTLPLAGDIAKALNCDVSDFLDEASGE